MKQSKTRPEERSKIEKSPVDKDEIYIVCSMARPSVGEHMQEARRPRQPDGKGGQVQQRGHGKICKLKRDSHSMQNRGEREYGQSRQRTHGGGK